MISIKNNSYNLKSLLLLICGFASAAALLSCEEFVEVDAPKSELITETVFENDKTATAAILGIYGQMYPPFGSSFANGDLYSANYTLGFAADDMTLVATFFDELKQLNENNILSTNIVVATTLWSEPYQYIYQANSILEGLETADEVSAETSKQLKGEALFIRAFSHFYLVNLFGDAPIATTTDFEKNRVEPRAPQSKVYAQIVSDLQQSRDFLQDDYAVSDGERVRPNRSAASALLARVFLYMGDWLNAELMATEVIDNSLYSLISDLDAVFDANSSETIWALMPVKEKNTTEAVTYSFTFFGQLSNELYNSFEDGDQRREHWTLFNYANELQPFKYQVGGGELPRQEYSVVLRLAEQYLIRAEARAQQDKLIGPNSAESDLNMIRNRAGLGNTLAVLKEELLAAIFRERRAELFTEWGHRWFDLKRSGEINDVLGALKPGWTANDALFPIPEIQRENNPDTPQNPGY